MLQGTMGIVDKHRPIGYGTQKLGRMVATRLDSLSIEGTMKPAPFTYYCPGTLDEAVSLLDQHGEDGKILAGGQSLMPLMSLRLARPAVIVDLNRVPGLDRIDANGDGGLSIGALTRQRALERDAGLATRNPLLAAAVPLIGHFQIRNRGTVGGSLVHADPAAELPAVTVALGADFVLTSVGGERVVSAEDFYLGYMATAVEANEVLTEIRLPAWKAGRLWAIDEVSRRKGDFAMVGVALWVDLDGSACADTRITLFGVGGKPVRVEKAEQHLKGAALDDATLKEVERIVFEELEPDADIHASALYRKEVGGVLTRRALSAAAARATEGSAS